MMRVRMILEVDFTADEEYDDPWQAAEQFEGEIFNGELDENAKLIDAVEVDE